jgi:hypothetical protein
LSTPGYVSGARRFAETIDDGLGELAALVVLAPRSTLIVAIMPSRQCSLACAFSASSRVSSLIEPAGTKQTMT